MIPIPNLPDNSHKILMLLGIAVILASFYLTNNLQSKQDLLYQKRNQLIDSLNILGIETDTKKAELLDKDTIFAMTYKRKHLISSDSTNLIITRTIVGDSISLLQTDTIKKYWDAWQNARHRERILEKKVEFANEDIKRDYDLVLNIIGIVLLIIGGFCFFVGLRFLVEREIENNRLHSRQNAHLPFVHSKCQSCGQRFSPMVKYGTDKDKTNNYSFCNQCYKDGSFTEPDITFEEITSKVDKQILNLSKKRKKSILKSLRELERWKKDRYQ